MLAPETFQKETGCFQTHHPFCRDSTPTDSMIEGFFTSNVGQLDPRPSTCRRFKEKVKKRFYCRECCMVLWYCCVVFFLVKCVVSCYNVSVCVCYLAKSNVFRCGARGVIQNWCDVPAKDVYTTGMGLTRRSINPIPSMYGIFTYIWGIFMVNVGKYTIHGCCGNVEWLMLRCIRNVFFFPPP